MTEELSKNTLLVLVVLTIVISLLGTWTVYTEASKMKMGQTTSTVQGTSQQTGKVSLTISEPQEPPVATGKVIINIRG